MTPFDAVIAGISAHRYHNHRLEQHSDLIGDAFVSDLARTCDAFRRDLEEGRVQVWKNVESPGDRRRRVDLFVGAPTADGEPDPTQVRIAVENKSVITAHRNATNRFDDLKKVVTAVQEERPEALVIATVLIGTCLRVLNVPDQIHKFFRDREDEFVMKVLPRLSSGDETLWEEFSWAISANRPTDVARTIALFRSLPTRGPAQTHLQAYDSVLLVPVEVDNVHPPRLQRGNAHGIDIDADYQLCLERTCHAYTARWHL